MMITKRVVETVDDENIEISLKEAQEIDPEAEVGDEIDEYIDYEVEFGRNAIMTAKQILIQKVREAERDRIYEEYIDKVGTMASGVVQQIDKGNVIVNLGRGEGILPIKEQIPREKFRQGDRIIMLFSDLLENHVNQADRFGGHVGGDDFFMGIKRVTAKDIVAEVREMSEKFEMMPKVFMTQTQSAQDLFKRKTATEGNAFHCFMYGGPLI